VVVDVGASLVAGHPRGAHSAFEAADVESAETFRSANASGWSDEIFQPIEHECWMLPVSVQYDDDFLA
jgi:hypothetical protein